MAAPDSHGPYNVRCGTYVYGFWSALRGRVNGSGLQGPKILCDTCRALVEDGEELTVSNEKTRYGYTVRCKRCNTYATNYEAQNRPRNYNWVYSPVF